MRAFTVVLLVSACLYPLAVSGQQGVPAHQDSFTQSGVKIGLGSLNVGQNEASMTLLVENGRDAPVGVAMLDAKRTIVGPHAILSDDRGSACYAQPATGIAEIPLRDRKKPRIEQMTVIPPHSRINAAFRFGPCALSRPVSFVGEFALSTDGQTTEFVTVPFWGLRRH